MYVCICICMYIYIYIYIYIDIYIYIGSGIYIYIYISCVDFLPLFFPLFLFPFFLGDAVVTNACGGLRVRFVVHAVGPYFFGGDSENILVNPSPEVYRYIYVYIYIYIYIYVHIYIYIYVYIYIYILYFMYNSFLGAIERI